MRTYLIVMIITIGAVGLALGSWWAYNRLQPASFAETERYVTIEDGASAGEAAGTLEENGIIRDGTMFYLYARFRGQASNIKSGFYRFSSGQTMPEILDVITEGRVENEIVRIPSGVDIAETVSVLRQHGFQDREVRAALNRGYDVGILDHKPDDANMEGYLYPDTYHIAANADAAELVRMALNNTDQHVTERLRNRWRAQGLSVHEGLTLSSIVQKEVAEPRQRAKVAQVFLTRLEDNQPLEADPTFQYAARRLDVEASPDVSSPYNTYQHTGLPPGPIATVTQDAMEAVANPADTDYRYFVTGEDGVTRFAKTRRQHQRYIDRHGVSGN